MRYDRLLDGKNCVITSGAHGMGRAISMLFARHGARLAICGKSPTGEKTAEALRALSPDSFFVQCDLERAEQVRAFAADVLERMGTVDVLVNCVGINVREPAAEIDMANFQRVQDVNLKAGILLAGAFVPGMMRKGKGSVVSISSIHSVAPSLIVGSYAASKGAVNAFSRALALEAGRYGVRSNVLCCGWVATTQIMGELEKRKDSREEQYRFLENLIDSAPCHSPARAEDIANHVLYLASDMSSFVTGATIMDDCGATLQNHYADFPEPDDVQTLRRQLYDAILDAEG